MKAEIIDRQALVWSGDTGHLVVPSQEGVMGILPGHTPLMVLLMFGRVEMNLSEGRSLVFEVDSDFMTVDEDRVYVVVEHPDAGHTGQPDTGQPGVLRLGTRNESTEGGDMRALDVILAVTFAGILAGLAFLSAYLVHLRGLLHKHDTFQCALRRKGGHWTPGIITLRADAIEQYPRRSLVLNSKWSFLRELLEIRRHRQGILPGTTVVESLGDGVGYETALRTAQFAGLVSWIGSTPPAEEPADFRSIRCTPGVCLVGKRGATSGASSRL